MKKTVIKILIFSLLISNIFVSYKLYKSSILQLVILNDYNTQNFSIEPESFDRFDISFPNLTQTSVPIKLLKGRYYKKNGSFRKAITLFKESIKLNLKQKKDPNGTTRCQRRKDRAAVLLLKAR